MTLSTTTNTVTLQGNGSNTNFPYSFPIPDADFVVITITTIADGTTEELIPSEYSITGIGSEVGGTVTYPLSGPALSSDYNLSIQRILPLTQTVDLVNQDGFYPEVVENEFDELTMMLQQLQQQINQALQFPVGSDTDIAALMVAILNGEANATAAAASAAQAAADLATLLAQLPVNAANIQTDAVTSIKIQAGAVTAIKLATSAIAQGAIIVNGYLTVTQDTPGAGQLTVALKTLAGTDPSATDPVIVAFRNATVGSGLYVVRSVTAVTQLVLSAGSTLGVGGAGAANAFRLWFTLFDDSGTVRIGAINCRTSTINWYPLGQFPIASSTAEGGAGGADTAGVFYTGTAVSSKPYVIAGWALWQTGLPTAAGTWDAAPTWVHMQQQGNPIPGHVVQDPVTFLRTVVTTVDPVPIDNTIPQTGEGDNLIAVAITPTSAANLLEMGGEAPVSTSAGSGVGIVIYQTGVAAGLAASYSNMATNADAVIVSIFHRMLAATITAQTFNLAIGTSAGTLTINGVGGVQIFGGVAASYFKVKEILV